MHTPPCAGRLIATLGVALLGAAAHASPPSANELGTSFTLLAQGTTNTVEIRLAPTAPFDSVTVEPASGATALSPPCTFASVVPSGRYVCRVNVTHNAQAAALSLNVIGERALDPTKPRLVEISHYTIPNAHYTRPASTTRRAARPPPPTLVLTPPAAAAQ